MSSGGVVWFLYESPLGYLGYPQEVLRRSQEARFPPLLLGSRHGNEGWVEVKPPDRAVRTLYLYIRARGSGKWTRRN